MDSFPEIEITEYKVYDGSNHTTLASQALNIAYGVDGNYLDGVGVSITSIVMHNDIDIVFHIVADEYNSGFVQKIEELTNQFKIRVCLYSINSECLENFPSTKIWSRAMYFRLFAFEYFCKTLDKLLYLDADIICKGRLDDLASVDISHVAAAVVKDVDSMQSQAVERLEDKDLQGKYFNSGVVYTNLKKWADKHLTKKALSALTNKDKNHPLYKYPDQDVLNILLKNDVVFLPEKFNTIYTIKSELKDKTHLNYKNIIRDETVLIHYTGATKPWHEWAVYPSVIYYTQPFKLSPWKNDAPKKAKTIVEFKKRYKHLLIQHQYLNGIIAGFAYLLRKKKWR